MMNGLFMQKIRLIRWGSPVPGKGLQGASCSETFGQRATAEEHDFQLEGKTLECGPGG